MKKEVLIENRKFQYSVRQSKKAKRMRIAVYCDCSVVVTSPRFATEFQIQKFIRLKSEWILKKIVFFSSLKINMDIAIQSKDHYLHHKDRAYSIISKKVRSLSNQYGFEPAEIKVKMLKTKWGSCSGKKNLNFNYKLIFLDQDLQNYIIIHELCHLKEMNHSSRFWSSVATIMPEYALMKDKLRSVGVL